MQGISST